MRVDWCPALVLVYPLGGIRLSRQMFLASPFLLDVLSQTHCRSGQALQVDDRIQDMGRFRTCYGRNELSSCRTKGEVLAPSTAQFQLRHLMLLVTISCIAVALFRTPFLQARNNQGHTDWVRASPFTFVEVDADDVQVQFEGERYELVSINGTSTKGILRSAHRQFGSLGEKRFIEDLPEVLVGLGASPDDTTVDLVLTNAAGDEVVVSDAPMTAENRSLVYASSRAKRSPLRFVGLDILTLAVVFMAVWGRLPTQVIALIRAFRLARTRNATTDPVARS